MLNDITGKDNLTEKEKIDVSIILNTLIKNNKKDTPIKELYMDAVNKVKKVKKPYKKK